MTTAADRAALREAGRIADQLADITRPYDVMSPAGRVAAERAMAPIIAAHRVAHLRGVPLALHSERPRPTFNDRESIVACVNAAAIEHAVRAMIRGDATRPAHIERIYYPALES